MERFDRKKHWNNIYQTKALSEVSWYQLNPESSLHFLKEYQVPKKAKIIDVGGGDSFLVDHLLELGYTNISVLDISATAIERAKKRLAEKASDVKWIVADVAQFKPTEQYDFWHDRAASFFNRRTRDQQLFANRTRTLDKYWYFGNWNFFRIWPQKMQWY